MAVAEPSPPGDGAPLHHGSPFTVIEWPFVGRAAELRQLRGLVTSSDCQGAVVTGHAGVGKTRLARETTRLVERAGLTVVRTTATRAAATLPLGPFTGLLPSGHPPGAIDDRTDLLRRSAAALVERASDRRLVVFVDDAHLLDDASVALLHLAVTQSMPAATTIIPMTVMPAVTSGIVPSTAMY